MSFFCKNRSTKESKCIIRRVSAKRQQAIADREAELLVIAEQLVATEGFANFTMDKLTNSSSYSKGTIYNHFNSKEDLISALCIKSLQKELCLFKHAATFEGNSREKCLAILYAYQKHAFEDPTLFMCVLSAKTPAVMEKSSPERLERQEELSKEVTQFCDGLFTDALEDGSLVLKPGAELNSLVFAIWAMSFGTNALMVSAGALDTISRLDNRFAQLNNANLLLDGMGWHPLSDQWNYRDTWVRIEQQLFTDNRVTNKQITNNPATLP
ncbi:MAG: TetR/AcrR family transcriptional regulator [Psychrosphaera sp.]|nr:TetR/AcrR family transcriptional regulator [Psychrosphaera sp.]